MIGNLGTFGDGTIHVAVVEAFHDIFEVKLLSRMGLSVVMQAHQWLLPAAVCAALIFICQRMRNTQEKVGDGRYGKRRTVVTVVLLVWSVLSLSEVSEFLYFNF